MKIIQCAGKRVMLNEDTWSVGDPPVHELFSTTIVEVQAIRGLVYAEVLVLDGRYRGEILHLPCDTEVMSE